MIKLTSISQATVDNKRNLQFAYETLVNDVLEQCAAYYSSMGVGDMFLLR
jgi:hypothetical protein